MHTIVGNENTTAKWLTENIDGKYLAQIELTRLIVYIESNTSLCIRFILF